MLATILVQTFFLGFFIWYTVVTQRKGTDQRSRERIGKQLERLSSACSDDLEHRDTIALRKTLELSRIAPTIESARLTDLNGRTISVSEGVVDRGLDVSELSLLPNASHPQVFKVRNNQLEGVTPVLRNGQPVALLWLEPNQALSQTTLMTVLRIAMAYGGLALLANILPVFLVVRTITEPLRVLRNATSTVVSNPGLQAGFPLPVTTRNEAGELTTSFNLMVRQLQERRTGLLETLALLDAILSNAPIGFVLFDRNLQCVRINEFLARLIGASLEEQIGRSAPGLFPDTIGHATEQYLLRVFATGSAATHVRLPADGPHLPADHRSWLMHFYPIRLSTDRIESVGVIVTEITDQLKAEETLRRTEKLAAAGRLAASIAHEINNPLEAVTNLLYLLRNDSTLGETATQLVATAESELARVSEITQQTLRFYRQSTSPSEVNVGEVLDSILRLYQPRVVATAVKVVKNYRGDPRVFGLGGELRQVFANLVANAIDSMLTGGVLTLRARHSTGIDAEGQTRSGVRVTIGDTGSGMSEETRRRIFEAFFTTKVTTGTGLGLWVSDEIVRKHCGTIRVRSRQGEISGTIFAVFIPDAA